MSPLFKKPTVLDKRLRQIQKELTSVNSDIRYLRKTIETPGQAAERLATRARKHQSEPEPGDRPRKAQGRARSTVRATESTQDGREAHLRGERFADYLASSFEAAKPLRHERRVQRNKAILMVVVAVLALFWLLYRFVL